MVYFQLIKPNFANRTLTTLFLKHFFVIINVYSKYIFSFIFPRKKSIPLSILFSPFLHPNYSFGFSVFKPFFISFWMFFSIFHLITRFAKTIPLYVSILMFAIWNFHLSITHFL